MLKRFRAIVGFSPRMFFALFLLVSFLLMHFNFFRHAKSRKVLGQKALFNIQLDSISPDPNDPDKLYFQAVQLMSESLADRARIDLDTEMLAEQPSPQTLSTCKTLFDETSNIRELLHDARLKGVRKFGDFQYAQMDSLIGICVYSAYHCLETGDSKQAAEILLDAWHLERLAIYHVDWAFMQSDSDSPLRLCIRRLGMRLKPNDPATQGVRDLIAQLLNESYVKGNYVFYAQFELLDFERQKDSYFLVDPFIERQYATQAEKILDNLRKIELGQFDNAFLNNFKPSRPLIEHRMFPTRWNHLEAIDEANIFFANEVPDKRLTALALACQLYRIQHNAWPTDINALAPDFIPKIPVLPIEPNPSARIYRVKYNGGFERILLTVGRDQDVLSPFREETMKISIIPFGLRFADLAPFKFGQGAILDVIPIAPTTLP